MLHCIHSTIAFNSCFSFWVQAEFAHLTQDLEVYRQVAESAQMEVGRIQEMLTSANHELEHQTEEHSSQVLYLYACLVLYLAPVLYRVLLPLTPPPHSRTPALPHALAHSSSLKLTHAHSRSRALTLTLTLTHALTH